MGSGQTVTGKYERKIKYLDYMENGIRTKGAGFVKFERWDGMCGISLQISGIYRRDHFTRPLMFLWQGQERELCRLEFADGGAKLLLDRLDIYNMDGQGMSYEEVTGVRIPVSEGKEIRCIWGEVKDLSRMERVPAEPEQIREQDETEAPDKSEEWNEADMQDKTGEQDKTGTQEMIERPDKTEMQDRTDMRREIETKTEGAQQNPEILPEAGLWTEDQGASESESSEEPENSEEPINGEELKPSATLMREEKWEQLQAIYPHVYPFRDEREYLSMCPADFVILPKRYYKLVSNSFLLHGFYNYDHLILARVEQRGAAKYYIGVPGNYYEREKKVAVLFGFQSFECESEPAQEGDFGYYMIPVEL